jgi:hypothetical protein
MKRVEKVKNYAGNNKVFVATMLVAVVFLLFNFVFTSDNTPQEEIISEISEYETPAAEPQREIWRFYFIDVIILGAGGGFCLIMLLRERRKTKEALK